MLTPNQIEALHELATAQYPRPNGNSCKALASRGYVTAKRAKYYPYKTTSYTITPEGQAAHDAIYTPEKIAADAAAAQAEKDARVRAAQEKRARLENVAAERNAASHELAKLLGRDNMMLLPHSLIAGARVHNDASGVWGGETDRSMSVVEILAIVKAALAEAQR
jgi:hypothetical protein